jgi:hypothetical protein
VTRAIVEQRREPMSSRTEVGHVVELEGGELELHFSTLHIDPRSRLIVEAEAAGASPVMCKCGLALYDDAAKRGACLDCEARDKALKPLRGRQPMADRRRP